MPFARIPNVSTTSEFQDLQCTLLGVGGTHERVCFGKNAKIGWFERGLFLLYTISSR